MTTSYYKEIMREPPCATCIVLARCKVRCQERMKVWHTTDEPVVIHTQLIPDCYMLRDYLNNHPREAYEYETSYMTQVIEIMGIRNGD